MSAAKAQLLLSAAKEGKWEDVAKLIGDKYQDLDEADEADYCVGETTLFLASGKGNIAIVTSLIAARADVNKASQDGGSALVQAANGEEEGHTEVAKALVAAGANLDVQSAPQKTALLCAMEKSSATATMLIAAKASLDLQDADGRTALHVSDGLNVDLVKALLSAGASPNIQDNDGKTALLESLMCCRGDGQPTNGVALALASSGGDVNLVEKNNRGALAFAARKGYTDVVKALIASNASLDTQTTGENNSVVAIQEKAWTPLVYAALENHVNTLKVLIDSNANLNTLDKDSLPAALHAAILKEHSQIVKELIVAGAKVGVTNGDGKSLLTECHNSDPDTRALLEAALAAERAELDHF